MPKEETNPDGSINWGNKAFNDNERKAHEGHAGNQPEQASASSGYWADTASASPAAGEDIIVRDQNEVRYYKPGATSPYKVDRAPGGGVPGVAGTPGSPEWVNIALETLKNTATANAANQAYLISKQQNDSDQLALNKAIQAGTEAYQRETTQLGRDRLSMEAGQFTLLLQERQKQYADELKFKEAELTGYFGGQATLAREAMEGDQRNAAYIRASAPARAFENELARGAGDQYALAASGPTAVPETVPGQPITAWQGMPQPTQPGAKPLPILLRTPAVINAMKTGVAVPTAGAIQAQSTMGTADQSALNVTDFRKANAKTTQGLNDYQKTLVGSYGRGGGVDDDTQSFYLNQFKKVYGQQAAQPDYALT